MQSMELIINICIIDHGKQNKNLGIILNSCFFLTHPLITDCWDSIS